MVQRRSFLLSALATAILPSATAAQAAEEPPAPTAAFDAQLRHALGASLGDPELAAKLAPVLLDVGFTWEAPSQPAASFQTIIAYSFGNRPALPDSSQPAPGPVNKELALAVIEAQRRGHATRIFAQWEIASFLSEQKNIGEVIAIDPVVLPDHSIQYLSTDGVAQAAVTHAGGDASKLGRVCVIGHHDHAKRCVETSRGRGMDAWAMKDLPLPLTYDPQSDQAWTRNREIYLIHDMAAQLMQIRAARLAAQTHSTTS